MTRLHPMARAQRSYATDPAVPSFDDSLWHVVMDAHCALCSATARRIARADDRDRVRIVPADAPLGRALLCHYGLDPDDTQSWLLVKDGVAFGALDAAVRLFPQLSARYWPLVALRALPIGWQNALYGAVARNRYRWFGRGDLCAMPDPAVRARLVR